MLVKMNFSKTVAATTLLTWLAISALSGCNNAANTNTPVPATTQPTLEATIQATPTQNKEEKKYGILSWQDNYRELSYVNGTTTWKTSIAENIEETILRMTGGRVLRTQGNLTIEGAFVDTKYERVIAWGKVQNSTFGKISLRRLDDGIELDSYWLSGDIIKSLQIIYEVSGDDTVRDYLVIAGFAKDSNMSYRVLKKLNRSVDEVPFIKIFELNESGTTPYTYHPLALVEGEITKVNPVRGDNNSLNLEITAVTYDARGKRNEGTTTVPLKKILDTPNYEPIFGG